MKRYLAIAVAMFSVATAQAALVGRDINGIAVAGNAANSVFLYDDVLNVTWLRNANAGAGSVYDTVGSGGTTTDGRMPWSNAVAWASSLNGTAAVGGTTGWRLPTMIDTGTSGCNYANVGTDCGYNVQTKSGNLTQYQAGQTVYSEMAHLFYVTLGNQGYYSTTGAFQPGYGLSNTGAFQNLQANFYWSGLEYAPVPSNAWGFDTYYGSQSYGVKTGSLYAVAVRSGDVAPAVVPVPAALPLLLSGLAALGVASRRRGRRRLGDSGASAS
ncbi:MAG: DUF1566 domain-containing protein [Burkholderiales bacterium]